MRRRFKAVMDVLGSMTRNGVSLPRSVELTAQWDKILAAGPLYPVTLDDFHAVEGSGLCAFHRIVSMVWLFIVGMRLLGCGGIGHRRNPLYTLTSGLGQPWSPLLHFFTVASSYSWWFWSAC